jgi:hypothetical protein
VIGRAKVWEGNGESRVAPALRDPGAVAQQAQGAQGFDQPELRVVEVHEVFIAAQQGLQLAPPVLALLATGRAVLAGVKA